MLIAAVAIYSATRSTTAAPPAAAQTVPDEFRVLGSWPLSGDETMTMVHVPDQPTGLRCVIYRGKSQAALYCDDDLPLELRNRTK